MSMIPLGGLIGSAAGAPLSQTAGSETERAQKDALAQNRQADSSRQADETAGIGRTKQDQESSERDADGRRLWEAPPEAAKDKAADANDAATRQSKDASGQSGTNLDLTG